MTATPAPESHHDERQLAAIRLAQEHERLKALHTLKKRRNFFLNLSGVSLVRATANGNRGAAWLARRRRLEVENFLRGLNAI